MRFPPPEVLVTWPKPNYINPDTRGPELMIVELITLPVAWICLALRMYVRLRVVRTTGWDDWLMLAAAIFGSGVTICVVLAFTRYGWENHVWDLLPAALVAGRQVSFAAQALFILATTLAKLSILISYLRLAPLNSWFRRLTHITMWFVGLNNVAFFVVLFAQCVPTSSYWNLAAHDDCLDEAPTLLTQAIFTVLSDFAVWALPLPALYRAKLPLSQRIALIVLFSFGLVVVFAACMRTWWIQVVLIESYDVTWEGFNLWLWTAVEVQLGIICGCVPWLKSLFKFVKAKGTTTGATGASSNTGAASSGARSRASRGSRMEGRKTISEGGAVFQMDGFNKYAKGPRDTYLDLESCHETSRASSPEPPELSLPRQRHAEL